jgi:hypothetical protein
MTKSYRRTKFRWGIPAQNLTPPGWDVAEAYLVRTGVDEFEATS